MTDTSPTHSQGERPPTPINGATSTIKGIARASLPPTSCSHTRRLLSPLPQSIEMVRGHKARSRWARPAHMVAPPAAQPSMVEEPLPEPLSASLRPFPLTELPWVESSTSEAKAEMVRVVRERFPDRSRWPEICVKIIRSSEFAERMRSIGDNGSMDYEMVFWAIQEAESADPIQAPRWVRLRTNNPSRLNIRPPPVVEIASIPPEFLPPGTVLPRVPEGA